MSYNARYFGEPIGLVKSTVADLARAVDPIYPPKPEPAVSAEIHVTTVPIATPRAPEPAPTVDGGAGLREVGEMLPPDEFWGDNTRLVACHDTLLLREKARVLGH